MTEKVLEVKNLEVIYQSKKNIFGGIKNVYAVNGVTISADKGEILAIAGESGCGKSTLAKAIMKLIEPKSGEIIVDNQNVENLHKRKELKNFYKKIQMIFQNPYASLNPKMKIGQILREPLEINTELNKNEIDEIVLKKVHSVGLDEDCLKRYPHEFSGGQRQRIAIARALVLEPQIIIADEPVSALDVSIQAQIINLLKELKKELNLTILFISHDLSVIKYISDKIAIMYLGEIVEMGKTDEIFTNPKHPYTKALLSSAPELNPDKTKEKIQLYGELPSPENLPQGCKFHTRCPYVFDKCKTETPNIATFSENHICKCFLYN